MKNNNIYSIVAFFGLSLILISCEKWLDVAPKTQIEANRVFEKESGFQDALTGVYITMTNESLYGREMTFGMLDGLAGQFNGLGNANEYYSTINYDYNHEKFIEKSNNLFENAYNAIVNLNTLIEQIDIKGPSLFSDVNYHIIRGEAHGLRAFLHFDLVRLYGSAINSEGETALAIPYVDMVGTVPNKRLTTRAILDKTLADLAIAAIELKDHDPIVPGNEENESTYLRERTLKFNYYAVKALEARVRLYAGDKEGAFVAAKEVIDSEVFDWTPASQIATSSEGPRNKIFTQELIFGLYVSNLSTITSPFYDREVSGNLLAKSPYDYASLFHDSDYRYIYLTTEVSSLYRQYSNKLTQTTGASFANRMPIIRKSELYYIAAECLLNEQPAEALSYLNEVLKQRNVPSLPSNTAIAELETEIRSEYRREFISEGQLFFYYKRNNISQMDGVYVTMTDETYVLPLPDREISYGQ